MAPSLLEEKHGAVIQLRPMHVYMYVNACNFSRTTEHSGRFRTSGEGVHLEDLSGLTRYNR